MNDIPPPAPAPAEGPDGQLLIYRDGTLAIQVRLEGPTLYLPQRLIAELFQVTVKTVSEHLVNIFAEGELDPEATIRKFRIVQIEGNRQVSRLVDHYNLEAILSVGYRVRSQRGTAFRQWASQQLTQLLVKGFTIDAERIKSGQTAGDAYFDELLEIIRDIRSSERLFYQKITDIYATSIDYEPNAETTRNFYATVQNKLHWAIHGHTAAEIIYDRADATKPHMGLTTWKNAPNGIIRKTDVATAKNYLTQEELRELNRIVSMYLDFAEAQARRRKPMHMADWAARLDAFLEFNEHNVLDHAGRVSHKIAEDHAWTEFQEFDAQRKRLSETHPTSDFDRAIQAVTEMNPGDGPPRKTPRRPKKT